MDDASTPDPSSPTSSPRWDGVEFGGKRVAPGTVETIEIPLSRLYTGTAVTMPVRVICGQRPGPILFVSAAIHGDEINGVEVIRRLLRLRELTALRGALVAVPVVNVHGFLSHSRYLPDRRDLNRAFPGSDRGSLAARMAEVFMREIVEHCTHGIDIHTGAVHRSNLPQVRVDFEHEDALALAQAFRPPVLLDARIRDGSLREAVADQGIPVLLYEGGEALRFEEGTIRIGLRGVTAVMRAIGMLPARKKKPRDDDAPQPVACRSSVWVRAPEAGIFRAKVRLGDSVHAGDRIGTIGDPFGDEEIAVDAPHDGLVIGLSKLPLANEGDALVHLGRVPHPGRAEQRVEAMRAEAFEAHLPLIDTPPEGEGR